MRRDQQRLNDILEAFGLDRKAIAGRTEADFLADETLCYSVAQKLTIVGGAVARLTPEITAGYNSVPWPDIVGLRNILVHRYVGIHWPLVWQTATDHAPTLRANLAEIRRVEFPASESLRFRALPTAPPVLRHPPQLPRRLQPCVHQVQPARQLRS
jgi:uncharacterized protein with HEPN domain